MTLINNFNVKDSINLLQAIITYYKRFKSVSRLINSYDTFLQRKFNKTLNVTEARSFVGEEVILAVGWQDNAPCFWRSLLLALNSGQFSDADYLEFLHMRLKRLFIKNNYSHELDKEILGYADIYSESFKKVLQFENVRYGVDDVVFYKDVDAEETIKVSEVVTNDEVTINVTKEGDDLVFTAGDIAIELSSTTRVSIVIGGAEIVLWDKQQSYNLLHDALNSWLQIGESDTSVTNSLSDSDFTVSQLKTIADRVKKDNDYHVKSLYSFWTNELTIHPEAYDNDDYISTKVKNSADNVNVKEDIVGKYRKAFIAELPQNGYTHIANYINLLNNLLITKKNEYISVLAFSHSLKGLLGFTVLPKHFSVFTNSFELLRTMLNDIYARAQYSKYVFVGELASSKILLDNDDNVSAYDFLDKRREDIFND